MLVLAIADMVGDGEYIGKATTKVIRSRTNL